ncbi:MAG: hypothetical protein M1834_002705 [Cirrosporium novae-zelandiae]|nr:MAG: hypothetical protein M1834_002705 [Cirrosporium novae-zelandiae]
MEKDEPVVTQQPPLPHPPSARGREEWGDGIQFPRVTIEFCTQCKWMLRAAYFAQELLSTFSLTLGEVSLIPSTSGTFIVTLITSTPSKSDNNDDDGKINNDNGRASEVRIQKHAIWDRKRDGGFPETKELKKRIRDVIDPTRNLGHVDGKKNATTTTTTTTTPDVDVDAAASSPSSQNNGKADVEIEEAEAKAKAVPSLSATAARNNNNNNNNKFKEEEGGKKDENNDDDDDDAISKRDEKGCLECTDCG